ncbi:MAG: fimbrillin family protein [Bacteroidaceae bacterium]|nr:fimbrillin family protein [Bacteroidaceae bacterium]
MMKVKKIYIAASIALLTLTLASCRKEEPYVGPCSVNFRAYMQEERVVSRGYANIDASHPSFTAGLFVHASYEGNNYVTPSTLVWNGKTLTTSLKLEQGAYTIYGYMPYNSGATFDKDDLVMTLPGLAGMSASNAMVIKPEQVTISNGVDKKDIYLEMDHLMARVTPYFYINDAEYAKLRTIKIKKVEFIHPNKAYTATVTYTDPSATDPSATHTTIWSEGAEMASAVTFYEETESPVVLEQQGKANAKAPSTCYFCPEMEISGLRMRVTYDVYDAKGNLTRPDAVAENSIKKISGKLSEATNYKLYIPLVPSYLYVLSDGDLDSDALVVE